MRLEFNKEKANTQTVQFRIDPDTNKMLTALRKHYDVTTGVLIKKMIEMAFESLSDIDRG